MFVRANEMCMHATLLARSICVEAPREYASLLAYVLDMGESVCVHV